MVLVMRAILIGISLVSVVVSQTAPIMLSGSGCKYFSDTQGWQSIKDSASIIAGDTLSTDSTGNGTVRIGISTTLLLKASTQVVILQSATKAATISLISGQILLKRIQPHDSIETIIIAGGCAFSPMGTTAAIRYSKSNEVSVAVIEGSMRLESPRGEFFTVASGTFASFDPMSATVKQGPLSEKAIASLSEWANAPKPETVAPALASPGVPVSSTPAYVSPLQTPVGAVTDTIPAASAAPKDSFAAPLTPEQPNQIAPVPASPAQPNQPASAAKDTSAQKAHKDAQKPKGEKPSYEFGVSSVTVADKQWTRIAFGVDIPLWKFGVFVDAELFITPDGKFSDKGWRFDKDNWQEGVFRKIRYIRFGHEQDPLFVKFGGLSNVSLGYGFVVDRFTNMLHYPDQKLPGLQVYLNDLTPLGLTLQTMIADISEFKDKGGIVAARFALTPLKATSAPLLNKLCIGATYATDINQFTPAKKWRYNGNLRDKNGNGPIDWDFALRSTDSATIIKLSSPTISAENAIFDSLGTRYSTIDTTYRDTVDAFAIIGIDAGIPIIKAEKIGLDIYGQAGMSYDNEPRTKDISSGWGFGAPGVALRVGPVTASVEYRHIVGRFMPGYFGTYYFDERVQRYPTPLSKQSTLDSVNLNGIYGSLTANIASVLTLDGSYQYLVGDNNKLDHRAEAKLGIGQIILSKIPKVKTLEGYFSKTNIWRSIDPLTGATDKLLDPTPTMYYGYRLGVEMTPGATLIWDSRFGYRYNSNSTLIANNNVSICTAITF